MSSRLIAAPAAMLLLAGCQSLDPVSQSVDPGFGEAAKHNAVVQTINPDPVYPAGAAEAGTSGVLGAEAVKRYRTDKVKQPKPQITTEAGSAGSDSGGSSDPN